MSTPSAKPTESDQFDAATIKLAETLSENQRLQRLLKSLEDLEQRVISVTKVCK